jgi:tellurite resistance protein TerC
MWLWIGFISLVVLLLALDLGLFHRTAHAVNVREALFWSGVWITLALLFNVFIYFGYENHWLGMDLPEMEPDGRAAAVFFFTGYVVEKSLSIDNLFVMAVIFSYFHVPALYQHRVLFWGILGAIIMRGAMILAGVVLIQRFHWVLYVLGAFLIVTAVRMLLTHEKLQPKKNYLVALATRFFPVTPDFDGSRFIVRKNGRLLLTPLALALIAVESADVVFAVDSIPAIFAITLDPFLVFTSNVFAILGLRSLYFAVAGIIDRFYYLRVSLAVVLLLVGIKMVLTDLVQPVPGLTYYTLGVIVLVLLIGVAASIWRARRIGQEAAEDPAAIRGDELSRRS